jgi:hypothetical protein
MPETEGRRDIFRASVIVVERVGDFAPFFVGCVWQGLPSLSYQWPDSVLIVLRF